jgi:hypothetical protein
MSCTKVQIYCIPKRYFESRPAICYAILFLTALLDSADVTILKPIRTTHNKL